MFKLQCLFTWLISVPLENVSQLFLEVPKEVIVCANQRFSPVTTRGLPLSSYFSFSGIPALLLTSHKESLLPLLQLLLMDLLFIGPHNPWRSGKNVLQPNKPSFHLFSNKWIIHFFKYYLLTALPQSCPVSGQCCTKCFLATALLASSFFFFFPLSSN